MPWDAECSAGGNCDIVGASWVGSALLDVGTRRAGGTSISTEANVRNAVKAEPDQEIMSMSDTFLRRRLWRKLESLPDERLYQVLDYIEFLEGKYGDETPQPDGMQRIAEGIQDKLRARRAAPWALKGVMGALSVVDRAVGTAAKTARGLAEELSDIRGKERSESSGDDSEDRPTKIIVD